MSSGLCEVLFRTHTVHLGPECPVFISQENFPQGEHAVLHYLHGHSILI